MARATARHILVDSEEQCNTLKSEIENGASFEDLAEANSQCPSGAQGGDLENTIKYGFVKDDILALINSSRGIIYASNGADFAERAAEEAKKLRDSINELIMN